MKQETKIICAAKRFAFRNRKSVPRGKVIKSDKSQCVDNVIANNPNYISFHSLRRHYAAWKMCTVCFFFSYIFDKYSYIHKLYGLISTKL